MNVELIKQRVEDIRKSSGDDEGAHSMEDSLHQAVLQAIASGIGPADKLAAEALKTRDIRFKRWFA